MPVHPQDGTDDTPLPCAEALVAATMTLMTVWADPSPHEGAGEGVQRRQLARRIAANLFLLSRHPDLAEPLRIVMARAHARWAGLAPADPAAPPSQAAASGQALH
jgi:hypothetical protein